MPAASPNNSPQGVCMATLHATDGGPGWCPKSVLLAERRRKWQLIPSENPLFTPIL